MQQARSITRRRRGITYVAAGAAFAGVLAACGTPDALSTSTPPTVSMIVAGRQWNVSSEMGAGFEAGVARVPGVRSFVTGPDIADGPAGVRIFEELTRSSPAGISIFTLAPDLFAAPVAAAARDGIPMIAVDNPPPDTAKLDLFVGNDNFVLGRTLAQLVVDQMNPRPVTGMLIIGNPVPGAPVLDQRARGLRAEFERLLPGVRILGPFDSRLEEGANLGAWRALVSAHPEALAFVGVGDSDSVNLGLIHKELGGSWVGAGYDLDPRSMAAVQSGDIVLVSPEHFLKGAVAGQLQATHAGRPDDLPTGWIPIEGLRVDRSNIDAIVDRQSSLETKRRALQPALDEILGDLPAHSRPLADLQ